MGLNNTIRNRESHACSLSRLLGGKKRIEDPLKGPWRHTLPLVLDIQVCVFSRRQTGIHIGKLFPRHSGRVLQADNQYPGVGHGLDGIPADIAYRQSQGDRIGQHSDVIRRKPRL